MATTRTPTTTSPRSTVRDVMTRDVVTLPQDASWKDAVRVVIERRVHTVPVVDEGGHVRGVVSEGDLLLKEELLARPSPASAWWQRRRDRSRARATRVADVMTRSVVTASPDTPLAEAARLVHRHRVGRLPVVDVTGRLVGIVARSDLLRLYLRDDAEIVADARAVLDDVRCPELAVRVTDGVIALSGVADRRSETAEVVARLHTITGAVGVEDRSSCRVDDVDVASVGM